MCRSKAALTAALLSTQFVTAPSEAQESRGQLSIAYQTIHIDGFQSSIGKLPIGTADTESIDVEVNFELNDRWRLTAGVPLIRKRYRGPAPHVPAALDPPRDDEFIDDGSYHTELQDLRVGLHYLLQTERVMIEPFFLISVPASDYPFFAHAAVGQNLDRLEIGTVFFYTPPLSDVYVRGTPAYQFVEKTLGVSINHWRLDLEVGYFFTPKLTGRLFVMIKEGNGLVFPDDFPPPRTGELWHQHDRLVRHNYRNAGIGVDYALNERIGLSFSAMTMIHGEQVHDMRNTLTVGMTRSF